MHLDPFELHAPTTVDEAVQLAGRLGDRFDYLAGGTDLLPNYKMRLNTKPHLIALDRIAALRSLEPDRIGAAVTLRNLERSEEIRSSYPALHAAVRQVATPLVRASATIGGNLLVETRCFFFNQSEPWRHALGYCLKADGDRCHVVPQKERCYATFSGDLAPALMAVGARVEIAGPDGSRSVDVAEMYDSKGDGIRRHHLRPGELLTSVGLPPELRGAAGTYLKLRVRPSFDFPELGVALTIRFEGTVARTVRLAVGGVETYPRRFDELTATLEGAPLERAKIEAVAEQVGRSVRPVHNTFLPPDYRKRMASVFVRRAFDQLRTRAGAGAVPG